MMTYQSSTYGLRVNGWHHTPFIGFSDVNGPKYGFGSCGRYFGVRRQRRGGRRLVCAQPASNEETDRTLQFEDAISKEYRDLANRLPTKVLLGADLEDAEYPKAFDELFRYFDLSNEQVCLTQRGRISEEVWER